MIFSRSFLRVSLLAGIAGLIAITLPAGSKVLPGPFDQVVVAAAGEHPWPQPDYDSRRSGSTPFFGPIVAPGATMLSVQSEDQPRRAPVVRADGTVFLRTVVAGASYIARIAPSGLSDLLVETRGCVSDPLIGRDSTLYASCANGIVAFPIAGSPRLVWPYGGEPVLLTALGEDDTIYFYAAGVVAAAAPTGELRWRYSLEARLEMYTAPTVGPDGTVFFAVKDKGHVWPEAILAVGPDGVLKWRWERDAAGGGISPLVVGIDGTLYYTGARYEEFLKVFAVKPDGTLKWESRVGRGGSVTVHGQRVYAGGGSIALDAATGIVQWILEVPFSGRAIVGGDGTIYIAAGTVYAVHPGGEMLWSWATPFLSAQGLAIGTAGELYVANRRALMRLQ